MINAGQSQELMASHASSAVPYRNDAQPISRDRGPRAISIQQTDVTLMPSRSRKIGAPSQL